MGPTLGVGIEGREDEPTLGVGIERQEAWSRASARAVTSGSLYWPGSVPMLAWAVFRRAVAAVLRVSSMERSKGTISMVKPPWERQGMESWSAVDDEPTLDVGIEGLMA